MKTWMVRIVGVLLLIGAAIFVWQIFFPPPERVIKKHIEEMAKLASYGPNEAPLAKFSNTAKLMGYFAPDIEIVIDVGNYQRTATGTEDLRNGLLAARNSVTALNIQLLGVDITVDRGGTSAIADVAAKVQTPNDRDLNVQQLRLTFTKEDGDWRLRRLEPLKTLH